MKKRISRLAARLRRLSPRTITALGLLYVLTVALADYVAPVRMGFTLFYVLGAAFVGWGAGRRPAALVSLVTCGLIVVHDWKVNHTKPEVWITLWNILTRLIVVAGAGWLTAEVTRLTRNLSQIVEERTRQWKAEAEQHLATSARLSGVIERFEQVVNNIAQVFWLTDVSKREITYISPGYEQIWGRKCEDLYRDPRAWMAALHPEDREFIARRSLTEQARAGYEVEYRIIRPDGAVRWIRDRAFPVRSQQGGVERIAGIAEDITQRKQAESALARQEALYRTLFDLSPDGILLEDTSGNILDANQAVCRSYGYSREELLQRNVRCFVPPEGQGHVEAHLAALRDGRVLEHEVWNLRKNGERCLIRLNEKPLSLPDGRRGVLVVARDVTLGRLAEMTKEVFLSLAAKLSGVRTPIEAARAIYASADLLWKWDAGRLSLYSQQLDAMQPVLFCDVIDGQRCEVIPPAPAVSTVAGRERMMPDRAELILRTEGDLMGPEFIESAVVPRLSASMMCVPLRREGQPVGVLSLQSYTPYAYTQEDLRTLQALADHCAGALERIRAETEQRRLEGQILEISDREQARIGQDLHDGLCQQLVILAFDANSLESQLSRLQRPEAATARRIADFLDQAITESRRLARGLFPIRLAGAGLLSGLEELARTTRERFQIQCSLISDTSVTIENSTVDTHLYRIAQEAVNNAVKHSHGDEISIRLSAGTDELELAVEDNGTGPVPKSTGEQLGMGLHIMDYRARSIGGTLRVSRGSRGGTLVSCRIPVSRIEG